MNKKVVIACCIGLGLYIGCSLWPHHSEFDDKSTLEDVMEMELPNYTVKKYISDPIIDCHDDFAIRLLLNLKKCPQNSLLTV
jgi:hypothetical protein